MCDGFSLVVDQRRWRPNNRLQSFDYLFIYTFLTTLEAKVSEEYNGYVYMVYQTQCDSITQLLTTIQPSAMSMNDDDDKNILSR